MASSTWSLSQRRTKRNMPNRFSHEGLVGSFDTQQHRFLEDFQQIRRAARLRDRRIICLSQRFQADREPSAYVLEIDTSIKELQKNPARTGVLFCTCESFARTPEEPCKHMLLFDIVTEEPPSSEESSEEEESGEESSEEEEESSVAARVKRRKEEKESKEKKLERLRRQLE